MRHAPRRRRDGPLEAPAFDDALDEDDEPDGSESDDSGRAPAGGQGDDEATAGGQGDGVTARATA